ncbi:terpenoid synthase [Daedaleopsis nitida]|nr:terpenoid synthase [Daedaleopsis nitida]
MMSTWPWPRRANPYYAEVTIESEEWFKSVITITPHLHRAYEAALPGLLAALAYPDTSREGLRTGIDLMILFLVVEEFSDVQPPVIVHEMVRTVIDAMGDPDKPRPAGETHQIGEMMRQFWARAHTIATAQSAKHFVETFTDYLHAVADQAEDRDKGTIRTIDEYFKMHRENAGVRPSYFPGEQHLFIPDEVYYHPAIRELESLVVDLVVVDNDIFSYKKEVAVGDKHNSLAVAMHQFDCDLDHAMRWVVKCRKEVETRFLAALECVPSWGPDVDAQVKMYIAHLGNWPRCNECWSFESGRCFGDKGRQYQKTRLVLLPLTE